MLEPGSQVHAMAEFEELLDFPPAHTRRVQHAGCTDTAVGA